MRIGILTFHHGYNYGGFLQVYALQKYLSSLGHDVNVINYANQRHLRKKFRDTFSFQRPSRFFRKFKKMMIFIRSHKSLLNCSKRINGCSEITKLNFDAVVLGSDEIWNFNNMMFGFDPCYFGSGFKARRIISYATSFGPRNVDEQPPEQVESALSRLDSISVRDLNSQVFVRTLTGREAALVADPTFLVPWDVETVPTHSARYAILYGVDTSSAVLQEIRAYATRRGLKLVALGYPRPHCDLIMENITPFQFLGWIKQATIVFTGMFHGCIFSILFRKPFVFCMNSYRKNKVDYIFTKLGLNQTVSSRSEIDNVVRTDIDYNQVYSQIELFRTESSEYIANALK